MHTYAVSEECAKSCDFTAKCGEINDIYLEKIIFSRTFYELFWMEVKMTSCGTFETKHIEEKEVRIEIPSIQPSLLSATHTFDTWGHSTFVF